MFAGSILNREELARLIGRSSTGNGYDDDVKLLWEIYLKFGVDGFAEINGQFALALFNPSDQTLLLAVDRWAARSLYFAPYANRVAFASESKALMTLDDVPARANLTAIDYLQRSKYLPPGRGPAADLYPVAPGSWVRLRSDGWEAGAYRPMQLEIRSGASEETIAGELRDTILAATSRLVRGGEPIGLALSAGVDSTLTLGAIRAVEPKAEIYTFTASYQRDDPDLVLAAEAARYYGTIHQEIIVSPDDLPRLLPELVWAMEEPVAREEMVIYQLIAREAAKRVPLVLYGNMADKLFAGMPRHLLVKAASELPWLRTPIADLYDYSQMGTMPRTLLGKLLIALHYRGKQVRPPHVLGTTPTTGDKSLKIASTEALNASLLGSLKYPTEVTAMERLHSWEGLRYGSIFHDRDVATCAFRIPGALKIHGRSRKYILRRAAEGILPSRFAARPKGLVRIARGQQLMRVVDVMANELLAPDAVERRGLFDPQEIARIRRLPPSGRYADDHFYHIWTLLLTEIWARIFLDGRAARDPMSGPLSRSSPAWPSGTVLTTTDYSVSGRAA